MRRGELWWANLPEPWGRRPVLLLARNEAYDLLTWIMVAPLSTRVRRVPTLVYLEPRDDGVPQPSIINLDNILSVRKEWLDSLLVRLRAERMRAVDRAIHFALSLRD